MPTVTLPIHREYWIIPTPQGRMVVGYRPNSMAGAIGPFSCESTATWKAASLEREDAIWHSRVSMALAAVAIALSVAVIAILSGGAG